MLSTQFDINEFNRIFEKEKIKIKKEIIQHENDKLSNLNEQQKDKSLLEMNLQNIIIEIKNTWLDLINDLLQQKYGFDTFTKQNRLFFIGLTIMIIGLILFIYYLLVNDEPLQILHQDNKPIEKYYIYQVLPKNN